MSWAEAVGTLNDSVLDAFGQTATVFVAGVGTDLKVVFEAPRIAGQSPTEHPFQRPDHQLTCRTADFHAIGAQAGGTVEVDGRTFFIADVIPDDGGMTQVVLRPA